MKEFLVVALVALVVAAVVTGRHRIAEARSARKDAAPGGRIRVEQVAPPSLPPARPAGPAEDSAPSPTPHAAPAPGRGSADAESETAVAIIDVLARVLADDLTRDDGLARVEELGRALADRTPSGTPTPTLTALLGDVVRDIAEVTDTSGEEVHDLREVVAAARAGERDALAGLGAPALYDAALRLFEHFGSHPLVVDDPDA